MLFRVIGDSYQDTNYRYMKIQFYCIGCALGLMEYDSIASMSKFTENIISSDA